MKVIEKHNGKKLQKRCDNCDSLLQYKKPDIFVEEKDCGYRQNDREEKKFLGYKIVHETVPTVQRIKYIRCPICGNKVMIGFIDPLPVIKGSYENLTRLMYVP